MLNRNQGWLTLLKALLTALAFYLIYINVSRNEVLERLASVNDAFMNDRKTRYYIYFVIILMPVNWLIEAIKWKKLTSRFFTLTVIQSLKAVMTGVAASFLTPNRSGDFAGRIIHLRARQRITGAICSVAGSLAQLLITVSTGCISIMLLLKEHSPVAEKYNTVLYIILPLFTIALYLFYFKLPAISSRLKDTRHKWLKKIRVFRIIEKQLLFNIYMLSALRYAVFTLQFFFLLMAFKMNNPAMLTFMLIMICFFLLTVIPSFALSEIGVRGSVCIYVFSLFGINSSSVLIASTSLWLINIVIPAIAGAVSLLFTRLEK